MRQKRVENEKERRFFIEKCRKWWWDDNMCFVAMAFGECNRNKFIELGYIFTSVLRMQNVMHTVQSIESVHIASPTEAADQWMYGSLRPTLVCLYISSSKCQHINPLFELQKATRSTAFYIRSFVCCVREFELVYYIRSKRASARARFAHQEMAQHTAKAIIKPKYAEQE